MEAIATELKFRINEDKLKRQIEARAWEQSTLLWTRRFLSVAVNITLVFYSALLVVAVYNNELRIQRDLIDAWSALEPFAIYAP